MLIDHDKDMTKNNMSTSNDPAQVALEWSDISQRFGSVQALKSVTSTVKTGTITALLGQNGAGKSTLIDISLGITKPASGTVTVFGLKPETAVTNGLVGCMLQNSWLPSYLTPKQLIKMLNTGVKNPLDLNLVLDTVRLQGNLANRKIGKLSGGERQRLRLGLALLTNPPLLMLDEPTTGMDVNARHEFWDLMQTLAQQGRTIFFATHYLAEVEDFAENVLVIDRGKKILDGTVTQMRALAQAHISFDLNPNAQNDLIAKIMEIKQGEIQVTIQDERVTLRGSSLDSVLRIVTNYPGTSEYQLVPASLDEAFTQMTQGEKHAE